MKKILLCFSTCLIILTDSAYCQNEIDALRYSTHNIFGSARYISMSGSYGALGGDLSILNQNPAGLAFYQYNEFSFTPSLDLNNSSTYYNSKKNDAARISTNLGNMGAVFSNLKSSDLWKRVNIGLGWNQLANYNKNTYIDQYNNTSSIADNFLLLANGNTIERLDQFNTGPAFWSDVIDLANNTVDDSTNWYLFDNGNYISHVKGDGQKRQTKDIRTTGGLTEFSLALSGSYQDKLYLGVSIGMPNINFYENSLHSESEFSDTINDLQGFSYEEELSVSGTGINIKIGGIARLPIKNLKIAAALHSPTFYDIEENYHSSVSAYFKNSRNEEESPLNYFSYQLMTPWKIMSSASINLNKNFLMNVDYELVDFSFSRLYSDYYRFDNENDAIQELYKKSTNIRIGAELRMTPFSLRSGYAIYDSPYKNNEDYTTENYSFGAGFHHGNYFFDVAYLYSKNHSEHLLYSDNLVSPNSVINERHSIVFTLGFKY